MNLETLHVHSWSTPNSFARLQQLCPRLRTTHGWRRGLYANAADGKICLVEAPLQNRRRTVIS